MALPGLDHRGLLPPGVHDCTLDDVEQHFCGNSHRHALWAKAREFLVISLLPVMSGQELILAGSFFSDKQLPRDIEATVVIDRFDDSDREVIRIYAARESIHRDYGLDFYPTIRVPGHNDFVRFFQYVGLKTAAEKGLTSTDRRGVVRIL